jgi:hypothetical protein
MVFYEILTICENCVLFIIANIMERIMLDGIVFGFIMFWVMYAAIVNLVYYYG